MLRDLTLLGLGAGLMYYLDPDRGRRRRALVRDQYDHLLHEMDTAAGKTWRDTRHRAEGLAAEASSMFTSDDAPDDVIVARVRSAMGRAVSHPHAIEVNVRGGHVTLSGPVLADEVDDLLSTVAHVRGVRGLENRLDVHEHADNIPSLQGRGTRQGTPPELYQDNWAPGVRALVGTTGGALLLGGLKRGGVGGLAAGALGAGLLFRSLTNVPARKLMGTYEGNRAFEFHDSINIDRPVEEVFSFLTNYENYPHFMPNVRKVTRLDAGHWRWTLCGPGGMTCEVEDVMTSFVPNEFVAWHSIAGSAVRYAGAARYVSRPDGGSTIHAYMAYNPPGGALGHGMAWLAGYDPKHQMQEIFLRAKSYLETGKVPHDAADPTPPPHHAQAGV